MHYKSHWTKLKVPIVFLSVKNIYFQSTLFHYKVYLVQWKCSMNVKSSSWNHQCLFLCMYGPIVLYFYGAFVAKIPIHFY